MILRILLLTLSQSPHNLLRLVKKSTALATGTALHTISKASLILITVFSNNFLSITFMELSRASSLCLSFLTCMNHFLTKNLLARNLFLSSQFSNNDLIKTRIFLNSIPSLNCSNPTTVNLFLIFSAISLNLSQFLNLCFNWNKAVLLTNISYLLDKSFQFFLAVASL